MVKVVDEVATRAEREALMTWLADKPTLKRELEEHMALRAVTEGWVERVEGDMALRDAARTPLARAESWLGVALLLAGLGLMGGWGLSVAVLDPTAPVAIRAGMALSAAGSLVLLASLVRHRMLNKDPYDDVQM